MARAGYCSGCGNYVFLRADGGCSNGHGPESISNPYEVPEAGAAPAAPQPSAYAPQAAYAAPATAPKKKRTGLIIAIVLVALLALCGCGVGVAALSGVIPNPFSSPEHQKVAVAGDFFKAVSTADGVGLARTIPTEAAAAADPTFWIEKLMEAESKSTLKSASWNNDVLTQVYADTDGAERTVVFTAIEGDKVKAAVAEEGQASGDAGILTMVKEATGWKVLALGTETDEFIRFDAATIKKLQEESK